ncbi:hypothetical protein PYW08_010449 [Mythimna loreyi]|uniref:Uncharacterized protein n=1 Tax=Mythimna loreyi TaxID=667449 RepID=A0ACC2Q6F8_9NEOP|nr:hypothetical protein PYW08_010449 [Mythimna loreyi]
MDHFSVVASLVLFGLFLITSPAEGFVRRYHYIDLIDQRLQASPWRRLTRQDIMDAGISKEDNRLDSREFVVRTPDNEDVRSSPKHKKNDDVGAKRDGTYDYPTGQEPKVYDTLAGPNATESPENEKRVEEVATNCGTENNTNEPNENEINAIAIAFLPSKY